MSTPIKLTLLSEYKGKQWATGFQFKPEEVTQEYINDIMENFAIATTRTIEREMGIKVCKD